MKPSSGFAVRPTVKPQPVSPLRRTSQVVDYRRSRVHSLPKPLKLAQPPTIPKPGNSDNPKSGGLTGGHQPVSAHTIRTVRVLHLRHTRTYSAGEAPPLFVQHRVFKAGASPQRAKSSMAHAQDHSRIDNIPPGLSGTGDGTRMCGRSGHCLHGGRRSGHYCGADN